MVRLCSYAACGNDLGHTLQTLDTAIDLPEEAAHMVFAFYSADLDGQIIHAYLHRRFPYAAITGGTTYKGIISNAAILEDHVIGLLVIDDDDGDYGVALGPLGQNPGASAQKLLHKALARAGCPGQIPELIWVYQAPGSEQQVIDGLHQIIGERCPILGGSAADDEIAAKWQQLGPDGVLRNGLAVAVLFSSKGIGFAIQSGCEPAGPHGIVTAAEGQTVISIDNLPAAVVYNHWQKNRFDRYIESGGNIAHQTALSPLGIRTGSIERIPHYQLLHPHTITSSGALQFFVSVPEGAHIYAMRGKEARVIQRARRTALQARTDLPNGAGTVAGGLITACAGFRMAMAERVHLMAAEISSCFSNTPLLGCFAFGEQGYLLDRNVYGNLMISAIAFGR